MSLHTGLDEIRAADLPHFSIGGIIGRSFWILIWNLFSFIGMAIVILVPIMFLILVVEFAFPMFLADFQAQNGMLAANPGENVELLGFIFLGDVGILLVQAAVAYRTFHSLSGRRASFGACLARGLGVLLHLCETTIILLAITILVATVGGWLVERLGAWPAAMIGAALGLCVLTVCWVVLPAMVVEQIGPVAGLVRSWRLTQGRRWQILVVILIFALIEYLFLTVLQLHFEFDIAIDIGGAAIDIGPDAGPAIVELIIQIPISFFAAIVMASSYYHLVGEKEGITRLSVIFA